MSMTRVSLIIYVHNMTHVNNEYDPCFTQARKLHLNSNYIFNARHAIAGARAIRRMNVISFANNCWGLN